MRVARTSEFVVVASRYGTYPVHRLWLDPEYWRMMVLRRDEEQVQRSAQYATWRAKRLAENAGKTT